MFFKLDGNFDFMIVISKDIALHNHVAQNGRSLYRAISKLAGNSLTSK